MKRTLQFRQTEEGYACFESDENIFVISKTDLQFNVKNFYQAFYAEGKDYEDIELDNCVEGDKDANRVYNCIISMMVKIKEKLAELPGDEEEADAEENNEE